MELTIFNIQHFSLHDGPGIRTTVFFKGCPLDCAWCHNPEGKGFLPELSFHREKCTACGRCGTVCGQGVHSFDGTGAHRLARENCVSCGKCAESCPNGALEVIGRKMTISEILAEVKKDAVFYGDDGGVTLSGGEPFAQPEGTLALLHALKEAGYPVCVETSGAVPPAVLEAAAPLVDRFLFDCKETDGENHLKYVGCPRGPILENLALLDQLRRPVILRCPIIPGVNDRDDHFEALACLAETVSCVEAVELEPYHPLGLAKAERLGKTAAYENASFLDRAYLEAKLPCMAALTAKPVRING